MAPLARCALVAVLTATGLLWPGTTRAWTETDMQSVAAHVSVRPDGGAHVTMELTVRVRRGWLEGIEVTGLDPDLVLDPTQPPQWQKVSTDETETPPPEADPQRVPKLRARGGRVHLSFPRRHAPRRGTYQARFAYFSTVQAERVDDDVARLQWTLPAWRSGLDGVRVTLDLPEGARPAVDPQAAPSNVTVDHTEVNGRTVITFHRVHLPRTVAWPVAVEVPADALDPILVPEPEASPHATPAEPTPRQPAHRPPWPVALLLVLVALGKMVAHRRASDRQGLGSRGIIPLPWGLRAAGCAVAATGGVLFYPAHPTWALGMLLGVALLTWVRVPTELPPARLGAFRPLWTTDRRQAARTRRLHRIAPLALLHLGSPAGMVVTTGLAAATAWAVSTWTPQAPMAWMHGLLAWLPLALAAGPRSLPEPPEARLRHLERLALRLGTATTDTVPYALGLWVHEDARGRWQDVRLRVEVPHPPPGLVHLDVAMAHVPARAELQSEPVLLAVTRRASAAEGRLDQGLRAAARIEAPGGRVARIVPAGPDADAELAALLRLLEDAEARDPHRVDDAGASPVSSRPAAA